MERAGGGGDDGVVRQGYFMSESIHPFFIRAQRVRLHNF